MLSSKPRLIRRLSADRRIASTARSPPSIDSPRKKKSFVKCHKKVMQFYRLITREVENQMCQSQIIKHMLSKRYEGKAWASYGLFSPFLKVLLLTWFPAARSSLVKALNSFSRATNWSWYTASSIYNMKRNRLSLLFPRFYFGWSRNWDEFRVPGRKRICDLRNAGWML